MTVDLTILPGLLLLALELLALAAFGFIVARVALRQADDRMALAQGMVIGPAVWGLTVNFILFLVPGLAGAIVGWVVVLALAFGLIKKAPQTPIVSPRTITGFLAASLAIFWIMLAARQLLKIPDAGIHLGLSSYIRAGGWPPATPWNPDFRVFYHHGVDLLIGLLAPPMGPNFVLVTELISAFIWTSLILVVATILLNRGGWTCALTLSPLLLTAGSWTLLGYLNRVPNIIQFPVPTELDTVGLRGSIAGLYWPDIDLRWHSEFDGAPANIWKPMFVLGYALVLVVISNAADNRPKSLIAILTLASLTGFLGIVNAELAMIVIGLWCVLEGWRLMPQLIGQRISLGGISRSVVGPMGSVLLLAVGGGVTTGLLAGEPRGQLLIGLIDDPFSRQIVGRYEPLQGRIGLLGIGALTAAALAFLIARKDRLVLALASGTIPLVAAALLLQYKTAPLDVTRFDGHARNLALLALLLALASRFLATAPRWRYTFSIIGVALVLWPTIAQPVRTIGLGVSRGISLTNPQSGILASDSEPHYYDLRRFVIDTPLSVDIAGYIRNHTSIDSRIFSPHPSEMSFATGRPNASGFVGHLHQEPVRGPEYQDVLHYLEPRAVRRLSYEYIHATNDWIKQLPSHAQRWLADPRFFESLTQSETDALYRVQAAFLQLDAAHVPESFEALRQAIPASASVLLAPGLRPKHSLQIAMALSRVHLIGTLDPGGAHLLTALPATTALGDQSPDFVTLPARMAPSAFDPAARGPLWWNREVAIYATDSTSTSLMRPPPRDFSIHLSDVRIADGLIAFTATFTDRSTDSWSGQDWVVVATDDSPWRLPYRFGTVEFTSAFVRWFDGQVQPVPETTTHEYFFLYEFEPRTGTLALWDGSGYSSLSQAQPQLRPGNWMLAARPNINREEVGLIPVLHFTVSEDGTFSYKVYEGSLDAMLVR